MGFGQRQCHLVRQTQRAQPAHQRRQGGGGHRRHAGQPTDGGAGQAAVGHIGRTDAQLACSVLDHHMRLRQQHDADDVPRRDVHGMHVVVIRRHGQPAGGPQPLGIGMPLQLQQHRLIHPRQRWPRRCLGKRLRRAHEPAGTGTHQLPQRRSSGAPGQRHRAGQPVQRERQQRRQQKLVFDADIRRPGAQDVGNAGRMRMVAADLAAASRAAQVQLQHQARVLAAQHIHQSLGGRHPRQFGRLGFLVTTRAHQGVPCLVEPVFERLRQTRRVGIGVGGRSAGGAHRRFGRSVGGWRCSAGGAGRCDTFGAGCSEPSRAHQGCLVSHQRGRDMLAVESDRAGTQPAQMQAGARVDEEADCLLVHRGPGAAQPRQQTATVLMLRQQRLLRLQSDGTHQGGVIEMVAEIEIGGQ